MLDVTGRVVDGATVQVLQSVVVRAAAAGTAQQAMCAEMLHWDDYRSRSGASDGAPSMSSLFAGGPGGAGSAAPRSTTFDVKDVTFSTEYILAADAEAAGSSDQMLCAEMIHWDDLRQSRGMLPPTEQPFSVRFASAPTAVRMQMFDPAASTVTTMVSQNVAVLKGDEARPGYCAEMEHYDDFCQQRAIPQQSTMQSLFAKR